MSSRLDVWLWVAQRATAFLLVVTVTIHLGTMIYVVNDGLSAGQILAHTRGSLFWLSVYGSFVTAAAIHVPIGLRVVLMEWTSIRKDGVNMIALAFAALLAFLGWRAVWGLYA